MALGVETNADQTPALLVVENGDAESGTADAVTVKV